MLHITNGDCAVAVLSQAVSGSILPWRDVLHEGPVRAGLSVEALSAERARFIAEAGWGDIAEVARSFAERDAAFRRAGEHDEIVLWFEHDLYDQLQLIQVLDGLSALRGPPISIVCEPEYLGPMAPARAAELFALRNPVTRRHLQEASAAWAAFRSPDPQQLQNLKTTSLPFLAAALRRHLEEFPWTTDRLSLLERHIVEALRHGTLAFPQIFSRVEEDPAFLGDAVLAWHLERLAKAGLIECRAGDWALTGKRRQRRLPRWLGGYEVKDEALRWDPDLGRLVS
ncbi:MAG TPA: DUF1835 domain-containing protein [Burkholderiales bacterium]|nr:DUF1835 domain-containing protein [Burkholderiales bacterium]